MLQLSLYQSQINLNQFSLLKFLSSIIVFSPMMAWILVAFIGVIFIVASFILAYHWKSFGLDKMVMAKASLVYFSVSSVLIIIMASSLAVYINSL